VNFSRGKMATAHQVAEYFLTLVNEKLDERLSPLKLQKLLYYAQGFHLAIHNKPLFADRIEAWEHGPVVSTVYHIYKRWGARGIPIPKDVDYSIFSNNEISLLKEVYDVFGQFSAWKLRNMTHAEPPWDLAFKGNATITNTSLKNYFKTQIQDA
jgi:uncharacterized phage-associated protein